MDASLYKTFRTSRGYKYHYFSSRPQAGKPTLLLAHGFPCTSYAWNNQVKFFKGLGYGLIAPDMLGYGGTDKPTNPAEYRLKLMVGDVMEILRHERPEKIIAIGHDWGSALVSRIANYFPNDPRFVGFGFMALSYFMPTPEFDISAFGEITKAFGGKEIFGYWGFFAEENAGKVIDAHPESFFSILFASDVNLVLKHVGSFGALKKWVISNQKTAFSPWLTDKEKRNHFDPILAGGLTAPLCWYKTFVFKHTPRDDADIPMENYIIKKPVFFGAALKDATCTPAMGHAVHAQCCPNTTTMEIDSDHWLLSAAPDKCNRALLKWIESL